LPSSHVSVGPSTVPFPHTCGTVVLVVVVPARLVEVVETVVVVGADEVVVVVGISPTVATSVTLQPRMLGASVSGFPEVSFGLATAQANWPGSMKVPVAQSKRTLSKGPGGNGLMDAKTFSRLSSMWSPFVSWSLRVGTLRPVRSCTRATTEGSSAEPGML